MAKWVKVGLLLLGIAAAIFTIEYIWVVIETSRQAEMGIYYPDLIFQWPLRVFFTISKPSILFQLPALGYVEFLIAFISPILAVIAARKLQYPPVYHLVWFILALLFPFLLIILAFMPRYSTEIGRRLEYSAGVFLTSIFCFGIGLFLLSSVSGSGDVVYIVGARWIGTDTPIGAALMVFGGFLLVGLPIFGVVYAILVALGIVKPRYT